MARYTPRVAVGIEGHTPTVHVRRGAYPGAGLAGMYADGPDIWPSAYGEAVGTPSHSCSVAWLEVELAEVGASHNWSRLAAGVGQLLQLGRAELAMG
jgi:hypothetical protein